MVPVRSSDVTRARVRSGSLGVERQMDAREGKTKAATSRPPVEQAASFVTSDNASKGGGR